MATAASTQTRTRSTPLCPFAGKTAYLTPTGVKVGTRGKVADILCNGRKALPTTQKGELRRLRKALRSVGRLDLVLASL